MKALYYTFIIVLFGCLWICGKNKVTNEKESERKNLQESFKKSEIANKELDVINDEVTKALESVINIYNKKNYVLNEFVNLFSDIPNLKKNPVYSSYTEIILAKSKYNDQIENQIKDTSDHKSIVEKFEYYNTQYQIAFNKFRKSVFYFVPKMKNLSFVKKILNLEIEYDNQLVAAKKTYNEAAIKYNANLLENRANLGVNSLIAKEKTLLKIEP
jgi:hypothetical protein